MRSLAALFLMLLVLLQCFSKWVIMADYAANRAFVARTLCENRARPQLKCGGRCQLMKRLADTEKKDASGARKGGPEEVVFLAITLHLPQPPVSEARTVYADARPYGYEPPALAAPFHPPAA